MILVRSSITGKSIAVDPNNIAMAEDIRFENEEGEEVECTRIYFKQPLVDGEKLVGAIDIQENAEKLMRKVNNTSRA